LGGGQDFAYALDKDEEYNLKVVQARHRQNRQQFLDRELPRSDNLPPAVSDSPGLHAYS